MVSMEVIPSTSSGQALSGAAFQAERRISRATAHPESVRSLAPLEKTRGFGMTPPKEKRRQMKGMKYQLTHAWIAALVLVPLCGAQVVASHAPTLVAPTPTNSIASAPAASVPVLPSSAGNPVARVNGAVLTDRDLMREEQAIFPYQNIHNGSVPKSMEPEMRKGALEMIIFEELLYQEALREKRTVSPDRLKRAEAEFRKQFQTEQEFNQVLQLEVHGSQQLMRERIRRSLLIEQMLETEVRNKARVSEAAALAYYKANPKNFQHPETFSIQTISIIPPQSANPEITEEARKKAENALKQAKATKTYQEFGLLAEKVSDDDWHVNMGDRKAVERAKLPPQVVKAALAMKPGQVSDLIQLGPAYTLFRLNKHTAAGISPFREVKAKLMTDLEKSKTEQLRSTLDKKLRKTAKIEVL
jgi:peptidyl-prolyl cis-trans isomerase SurA